MATSVNELGENTDVAREGELLELIDGKPRCWSKHHQLWHKELDEIRARQTKKSTSGA